MISTVDLLRLPPFELTAEDVNWVHSTREGLSTEDKVRQLIVLSQPDDPQHAAQVGQQGFGGVHRAWGADFERAWQTTRAALQASEIPPFVTGDLEGGRCNMPGMTPMTNLLGTAAMDDLELSRSVVDVIAAEGRAMGFNWSFTPVADINAKLDSAVVGTRSYGDDVQRIIEQSRVHIRAMQARGLAATAKHWPGEGFDARDQHLVTTVNPLGVEEWTKSFGRIYTSAFDAGVMTVMAGHIALPAWARHIDPDAGLQAFRPASVSFDLNTRLLRQQMGFNGVVVSDATSMGGFGAWADRAQMVPETIASGCDVFLFCRDVPSDVNFMLDGLRQGVLSEDRLEEAVTRVLGLKAALGLHRLSVDERLLPQKALRELLCTPSHLRVADASASASVTLVKDRGVLPLDIAKHRRIVVISGGIETYQLNAPRQALSSVTDGLAQAGFEVRFFDFDQPPTPENTDLVLYLISKESHALVSRTFLDWRALHGGRSKYAMRRYWHEMPTVMVSFGHAGHLVDAPRMPTYINAYSAAEPVQHAVVRKLLGKEPFRGINPVDPFCGLEEARW